MIEFSVLFLALALAGPGAAVPAAGAGALAEGSLVAPDSLAVADSLAAPRPVLTLPEVRVDRDRPLEAMRATLPTAHVTEIHTGAAGRAIESIPDHLVEAVGARVIQYGGLGAFATLSIRGAPSGQIAMLLDGVPLNTGARSVVNLADLPATAIERIEVYRGVAPVWLGVPTAAGAVNFVTLSSPTLREARVARGSFDTWEARATTGAARGPLSVLVHMGYQGSDGDFRYPDDNGTPFNAADDSMSARRNNRFDAGTLLAKAAWTGPGARAQVRQEVFHKAQGVPGIDAVQTRTAGVTLDRALTVVSAETEARALLPRLRVDADQLRERSRFRDPRAELGLGRHDTDDRLRAEGVNALLEWRWLPLGIDVRLGGVLRADRARLADAADASPDPPESRRTTRGVSVDLEWQPLGTWLTLHAARRWDRIEDHLRSIVIASTIRRADVARVLDTPQLGARVVWRGFEARANWTEAERAPDFLELFGNQGTVLGNPQLVPERTRTYDAGLAWVGRITPAARARVEWAHFESRPANLIHYLRISQSSVRATNLTAAKIGGDELTAALVLDTGLDAQLSVTRQHATDEGAVPFWRGKRLPMEPGRQAYGRLGWRFGAYRAGADLHYIGDDYLDRYNRTRVPSRTIVGATLGWRVRGLAFVLDAKNLADRRIVDVANFPLPGRSVFFSIHAGDGARR